MAKTYYSIQMDYLKTAAQAKELEKVAAALKRCSSDECACKGQIAAAWQGDSAGNYLSKLDRSAASLQELSRHISEIAQTVARIAKRTYESEKRALDISTERTY